MINTTDLQEVEISLPGDWIREDTKDIYSFTTDKMEFINEQLFKQLYIRHREGGPPESLRYTLLIKGDFCGLQLDDKEYVILQLTKLEDGSASMEWEDDTGRLILLNRTL